MAPFSPCCRRTSRAGSQTRLDAARPSARDAGGRADGADALLIAPTGGGKTLAGFLPSLVELAERPREGLHTLYISPLKALATDIAPQPRGAGRGDAAAGPGRDPHRRHAAEPPRSASASTPPQISADHAGKPGAAAVLRRCAGRSSPASRCVDHRRAARPRRHQARRSAGALPRAAGAAWRRRRRCVGLSATVAASGGAARLSVAAAGDGRSIVRAARRAARASRS